MPRLVFFSSDTQNFSVCILLEVIGTCLSSVICMKLQPDVQCLGVYSDDAKVLYRRTDEHSLNFRTKMFWTSCTVALIHLTMSLKWKNLLMASTYNWPFFYL